MVLTDRGEVTSNTGAVLLSAATTALHRRICGRRSPKARSRSQGFVNGCTDPLMGFVPEVLARLCGSITPGLIEMTTRGNCEVRTATAAARPGQADGLRRSVPLWSVAD